MIKNKSINWTRFTVLFAALFCSTLAVASIKVELEVVTPVGGDPELKVKAGGNPSQCPGGPLDCIQVGAGKTPYIIFRLPNACDGGTGNPVYKLAGMRITQVEKVWPTAGSPLNALVAVDYKADPNTGEIDFQSGNNNKTKKRLKFKNRNTHAYTIFYEITAEHCDSASDADDINLDPQIRNQGNN
jgi:hypothetical protein